LGAMQHNPVPDARCQTRGRPPCRPGPCAVVCGRGAPYGREEVRNVPWRRHGTKAGPGARTRGHYRAVRGVPSPSRNRNRTDGSLPAGRLVIVASGHRSARGPVLGRAVTTQRPTSCAWPRSVGGPNATTTSSRQASPRTRPRPDLGWLATPGHPDDCSQPLHREPVPGHAKAPGQPELLSGAERTPGRSHLHPALLPPGRRKRLTKYLIARSIGSRGGGPRSGRQ
jgi:hypothetical protein